MLRRATTVLLALAFVAVTAAPVLGQGTQTGILRGTVTLPDGDPVPGATLTAESPQLLGERITYTSESGEFLLRGLPAGQYTVTFELEGLEVVEQTATVSLGQVTPLNVTMSPEAVAEEIVVTGAGTSVLASSEVSTTYTAEEANQLPIGVRTPSGIASLAPGLTNNTPNGGQVTISGGFAYDNVFLIDGVDANDNLFGTSNPVFIEEAISDVQVLTSGISAEYGRFSGGVVNVVTKTGGNEFTGSLRRDMTNDDWREKTPREEELGTELQDNINEFDSATLGGYFLRDRLWFFGAGRTEESSTTDSFFRTGLPQTNTEEEDRWEIKLTGNIADRHQIQGTYTERESTNFRPSFGFSATPDTFRTRTDPNDLKVVRYLGALTNSLFGELQYSEKHFGFRNSHGNDGLVESSPFLDWSLPGNTHYNAPYFDGTDPEDRDNEQLYGSLSWFADTEGFGSHDVKFGVEDFTSTRVGGNSQTPTDFVFFADPLRTADGGFALDENQKLIPVWNPFNPDTGEGALYANWLPTRGAKIDINTLSAFINDRWRLNEHWSFNLGVRYEQVEGNATGGIVTVDTDAIVPRLGASYDLRGDGKYRFDATFSQYAGKYSEAQFAENTTVGIPRLIVGLYVGPAGEGFDHAPGFDVDNNYVIIDASDGTANVFMADDISSPVVDEITLSAGMQLERGGYLKLVYTDREYSDFVEDFVCVADAGIPCPGPGDTGTTFVTVEGIPVGTFNNTIFDNSNAPTREYQALQLLGRYQLTPQWSLTGNWTYQLKNDGNFEGEGTNTPGVSSTFGEYPGYFVGDRHFANGTLNDFQEHKVRVWTTYVLGMGRFGQLASSVLASYDSPLTFSFTDSIPGPFTAEQERILGFYDSSPGATQGIFFGERGAGEFESTTTFDLGLLYEVPVWKRLGAFVKVDVFNIFNEDKQISWNTEVEADLDGPVDEFGLPTDFSLAPSFGNAEDNGDFVDPREYRLAVGFRF